MCHRPPAKSPARPPMPQELHRARRRHTICSSSRRRRLRLYHLRRQQNHLHHKLLHPQGRQPSRPQPQIWVSHSAEFMVGRHVQQCRVACTEPVLESREVYQCHAASLWRHAAGEYQENMMGEGSQGGTMPIYNSGSEQSGWSDVSYNVKDSTSLSALSFCVLYLTAAELYHLALHCVMPKPSLRCKPTAP